jgi:hypothetical protein
MKIIEDKEGSLDELVVRARKDKVLKDIIDGVYYGDLKNIKLREHNEFNLMNVNSCLCAGEEYFILGSTDGRVTVHNYSGIILDDYGFSGPISMMAMPSNQTLFCCFNDNLACCNIYDGPEYINPREIIKLPAKPEALSASVKEVWVKCNNEILVYDATNIKNIKRTDKIDPEELHFAKGPSFHFVSATKDKVIFDADRDVFDLGNHVKDAEILGLEFFQNLVAFSYQTDFQEDVFGVGFLQVDFPYKKLELLKPVFISYHPTGGGMEREETHCFFEMNSDIMDISISPGGVYFAYLSHNRFVKIFAIENEDNRR